MPRHGAVVIGFLSVSLIIFKKLIILLDKQERKHAVILVFMFLIMALLDMIGVASIMPFISVLSDPLVVETNPFLARVYVLFNFKDRQDFLLALGIFVFLLLLFSLVFKAVTTYAQLRFALMREYSISRRLVEGYLGQPFSWFLNRHSADIGKNVLSEVSVVINSAMVPMITLIARGAGTIALLSLLIIIDAFLALTVGVVLVFAYFLVFQCTRSFLLRIGEERVQANETRFTSVSEAFGAIKEVKVRGQEQTYVDRFALSAQIYAKNFASASIIGQLPRFALEAIAFGGMILVILYLMTQSDSFSDSLPIITLYAFAAYRLIPALQSMYAAITQLRFSESAVVSLHSDLAGLTPTKQSRSRDPLPLKEAIQLNNIHYYYPNSTEPVLKGINLKIPSKSMIGLVGTTGSGKTTVVDLILGLLEPKQGSLEIDGQAIDKQNRHAWQRSIGYVPQQIYLSDDTISSNIAFGIDPKNIDFKAVERAAKTANLEDFVVNELPDGFNTKVGERGVRLSGGQRQRIGIARALYHDPQLLIFDEATSALDSITEKVVMDAINTLSHKKTIILVAHRLTTVKKCDSIVLLERGLIKDQGTFESLRQKNADFSKMVDIT